MSVRNERVRSGPQHCGTTYPDAGSTRLTFETWNLPGNVVMPPGLVSVPFTALRIWKHHGEAAGEAWPVCMCAVRTRHAPTSCCRP